METTVVVGPPGTGKTTWLAAQVEHAVSWGEIPMVVSLTRAAAREAAGRGLPIPQEYVSTLHAQAYRVLNAMEIAESSEHLKKWNQKYPYWALSGGRDLEEDNAAPVTNTAGDELMGDYQVARARLEKEKVLLSESATVVGVAQRVRTFAKAWEEWKLEEGVLDFTDLIEVCLDSVSAPVGGSLGAPTHLFVDEAQDMSQLEMALIRKWGAAAGKLTIVGDPWQNLYEWRGTDSDAMGAPDRILEQSHRVPRAVHARAVRWMQKGGYSAIEYKPRPVDGAVVDGTGDWTAPWVGSLMRDIEADVEAGRTAMVLSSCEYMIRPTIAQLRAVAMPFHNPYRVRNGHWNPLRGLGGGKRKKGLTSSERVLAFLAPKRDRAMRVYRDDLLAWTKVMLAKHLLVKRDQVELELDADPEGVCPIDVIDRVLTREALVKCMRGDLEWFQENLLRAYKRLEYPIAVAAQRGPEALEKIPQVIVGTIHSVKGGEADSVYLFPDLSPKGYEEWLSRGRKSIYRLFYVGMTRAKDRLIIMPSAGGRLKVTL